MTSRVAPVGVRIISINQPSFIKGRFILESVVATQEVIHDVHSKNHSGLVLKPNCEKTYDCMNWDILDKDVGIYEVWPIWRSYV